MTAYPLQWRDRIPAQVLACLTARELRIIVHPGQGMADGGIPWDVPMDLVPLHLCMPNTRLWIRVNENMEIQEIWPRDDSDE